MKLNLYDWAFIKDFWLNIDDLAKIALKEVWKFAHDENPTILSNYLKHTFTKLQVEKLETIANEFINTKRISFATSNIGIGFSSNYKLAAFNTGLVNYAYDPVIAVFEENESFRKQPYKFKGFCVRGQKGLGQEIQNEIFEELTRAKYFSEVSDCVYLDPNVSVQYNWDHIIIDGIINQRFPDKFILNTCASAVLALGLYNKTTFNKNDCKNIAEYVKNEEGKRIFKNIKMAVESAVNVALKRVSWNFKTAIPVWYVAQQRINLLLPLALAEDLAPDAALVVEQIQKKDSSGKRNLNYTAHTIYTLPMAYNDARLVCKPDSDWLLPQHIRDSK